MNTPSSTRTAILAVAAALILSLSVGAAIAAENPCACYDRNGDGRVSFMDLGPFSTAYGSTSGEPRYVGGYDRNQDGKIDWVDIAPFSGCYGSSWAVPSTATPTATATFTPTCTPTDTPTRTPTATSTATHTATVTATATPTSTPTSTATPTPTPQGTININLTATSFNDFDACTRDTGIDVWTTQGSAQLGSSDYLIYEIGNVMTGKSFSSSYYGRKIFVLDAPQATGAKLYFFQNSGSGTLGVRFNGTTVTVHSIGDSFYGGWTMADIPANLLVQGNNEVRIVSGGTLYADTAAVPPTYSSISTNGGSTWTAAPGEWLIHLRLLRHPAQGVITSDVIDLANPNAASILCQQISVNSLSITSVQQIPAGTSVSLEARSGGTIRPDASWTAWGSAAGVAPARFVQWRATLQTTDHAQTPTLESVTVSATAAVQADPAAQGNTLAAFANEKIIRSSQSFEYQKFISDMSYGGMPKLDYLRTHWNLAAVVASGATELDKMVLLRNWARRQWPHNEGAGRGIFDAIDILNKPAGDHGACGHFAVLFMQGAQSLGYNARKALLNAHGNAEFWSHEYKKWILMDVESLQAEGWSRHGTALYWDQVNSVPMSVIELHRAVLSGDTSHITQKYYMTDTSDPASTYRLYDRVYGTSEYSPYLYYYSYGRNSFFDRLAPDEVDMGWNHIHSNMYTWWKDSQTYRVEYSGQTDREKDLFWTLDQAALTVTATAQADVLSVGVDTVTPNFDVFRYRIDGGAWQSLAAPGTDPTCRQASLAWTLHAGANTLEVRPRNLFGIEGIVSSLTVTR